MARNLIVIPVKKARLAITTNADDEKDETTTKNADKKDETITKKADEKERQGTG